MRRFLESRSGVAGLVLLALLVLTGFFGPLLLPFPEAGKRWHDITYWEDGPAAAPPAWTGDGRDPYAGGGRLAAGEAEVLVSEGGATRLRYRFDLGTSFAHDLTLVLPGRGRLPLLVTAQKEEGLRAEEGDELARLIMDVGPDEPARLELHDTEAKILLVTELVLPGTERPSPPTLVVRGKVSGLLGTDASRRDVFAGVVLGLRWALLLGVAVSFLTVMTGLILGVGAACYGGWVDWVLNRVYEFFSLMPVLPFLIVLSAVYKPDLWTFALLALLFFWTRAFKPVYAMALHIREEGHIEAGKSIGAGRWYRAFHYVLPPLLPYAFGVMALSVPGIILYEAGVSLLGLGDVNVVTWGQMLHDALVQGAVINRLWWWVLPPGLMIALTGITFALLGRGFERVVDPWR